MDINKLILERRCLDIAKRHILYLTDDPNLGLSTRKNREDQTFGFYYNMLSNLGMLKARNSLSDFYSIEANKSPLEGRIGKSYLLQDLIKVLDINDNQAIFEILESSGAVIGEKSVDERKEFLVEAEEIKKILKYLQDRHAIKYNRLNGKVK